MHNQFHQCILTARAELEQARQLLNREISHYPTPISGCDAQFNHFLAERQKVLAALASLDKAVFVPTPRHPSAQTAIESR